MSPAPGHFSFTMFTSIGKEKQGKREREREMEKERKKERGRRGGESNKGQEKGTEGTGGGERRAQSGGVCPRRMNEIFISDAEEMRLLSRIFLFSFITPFYFI